MNRFLSFKNIFLFSVAIFGVYPFSLISGQESDVIEIKTAIVKIVDSANIPAELEGVISELSFEEGSLVKTGDIVVQIKSDDLALRLKKSEAEYRIAKAKAENRIDIAYAEKSAEVSSSKLNRSLLSNQRSPGVVPRGRVQEQELEVHRDGLRIQQATRSFDIAKMELELAAADVELSKSALAKASLVSPINGVVTSVEKKQGEWVKPGESVMEIVRLDRLKLEGFVLASEAGRIRVGDTATAFFDDAWLEKKQIKGKVMFVSPKANPVNSQVQVWVEIENRDQKLISGLEASVKIECSR